MLPAVQPCAYGRRDVTPAKPGGVPDGGEPESSLPKFTPVTFTSAMACNGSTINNPDTDDTCNVETSGGKVLTSVTLGSYTVTINFIG